MEIVYFLLAIIFILLAHGIRMYRWRKFISIYEKPNNANLLDALALGYFLNFLLPYKLGDLFRAYYAGRKMKNGKSFSLATVVIDRCLDIFVVGGVFAVLAVLYDYNELFLTNMLFYVFMAGGLLAVCFVVYVWGKTYVKKFLRVIAGLFNERIELLILNFGWSLIQNIKDIFKRISKPVLLLYTTGMWGLYCVSYYFLARFLSVNGEKHDWKEVFIMLFAQSGISESILSLGGDNLFGVYSYYMIMYFCIPLVLMFVIASISSKSSKSGMQESVDAEYLNLLPWINNSDKLNFLEKYFEESNKEYLTSYMQLNQNISIIRDYTAGSSATTLLCRGKDDLFFRKYAFESEAKKLNQQIKWIESYNDRIPLPEIIASEFNEQYCYYDMVYNNNVIGMFEYIHSMPLDRSWNMLKSILECLENNLYISKGEPKSVEKIEKYINNKIFKNINIIRSSKYFKPFLEYPELIINGTVYPNILCDENLLDQDFWISIFHDDECANIHGDLTIENIICYNYGSGGEDAFYLIDPNVGNIHETVYLDYAKLLQSLHGGYELLHNVTEVTVNKNVINFIYVNSDKYHSLLELYVEYLKARFGMQGLKSIFWHELVHWFRLMPYRIDKSGRRSVIYFARLIIIWQEIISYEKDEKWIN